eukprot:320433-Chlamydomonas_euryale.AAC.1
MPTGCFPQRSTESASSRLSGRGRCARAAKRVGRVGQKGRVGGVRASGEWRKMVGWVEQLGLVSRGEKGEEGVGEGQKGGSSI